MENGVYLVGAGPGDPDLLTLKAARILSVASALVYDRLVGEELPEMVPAGCEKIYVGKQDGVHTLPQPEINELLYDLSRRVDVVVRLKGGDPFVFGRGGEEMQYLVERGVPVTVVPGISSSLAVPALAGIPLTRRGVAADFAVITGHNAPGDESSGTDWSGLARVATLVFLMGVRYRQDIARKLITHGRSPGEPVAFIERGSLPEQRLVRSTLGEVAEVPPTVRAPAVFVVGEVTRPDQGRATQGNIK